MSSAISASAVHAHPTHALWNPSAAANWSVPFSPAFGAYVQMLNWQELGQPEKAAESRSWFYASVAMLATYMLVFALFPTNEMMELAVKVMAVAFLVTWYFVFGKQQIRYLKSEFDDEYAHRPWGRPIGYALAVSAAIYGLSFLVGALIGVLRAVVAGA